MRQGIRRKRKKWTGIQIKGGIKKGWMGKKMRENHEEETIRERDKGKQRDTVK